MYTGRLGASSAKRHSGSFCYRPVYPAAPAHCQESHQPLPTHSPRIPVTLMIDSVIVDIYPLFPAGYCPRSRAVAYGPLPKGSVIARCTLMHRTGNSAEEMAYVEDPVPHSLPFNLAACLRGFRFARFARLRRVLP